MPRILKSKKFIIILLVIILITVLWSVRIIPSGICILTAKNYVNAKYPDRCFEYSFIEYSLAHGKFFVHFSDREGKDLNLMTSIFGVDYDPLDPPG